MWIASRTCWRSALQGCRALSEAPRRLELPADGSEELPEPPPGRMWAVRTAAWGARAALASARTPALRRADELLVRVRAAGVNPLDVRMQEGYGRRVLAAWRAAEECGAGWGAAGGAADGLPLTVGRELVGDVVRAGPASRLRRGQRVWAVIPPHCTGAHAQYAVLRDDWATVAPERFDDAQAGSALYAALSACAALRAGGVTPGGAAGGVAGARGPVLLLGLGGAGQAALQLLRRRGALVVVGCAGEQAGLARSLGADVVLDRHAFDYADQLADRGPYWLALDCAGLGGAGAALARARRYVTLSSPALARTDALGLACGLLAAAADLARDNLPGLMASARGPGRPGLSLTGPGGGSVRWAFFRPHREDLLTLRRLADAGELEVSVQRVFPSTQAQLAYAGMRAGHARGKLVLDMR